jgi:hypothetical protein
MFIEWSSTKYTFFFSDMKFKMAATAGLSLTLDPMGKMFQIASSLTETTWTIETKLPRNDHWKVLYKVSVFYAEKLCPAVVVILEFRST